MESLERIREEILQCKKCELYRTKTKYVPGSGSDKAEIFFIGEAPGREEDARGEPFVGSAGKLLMEIISLLGLRREEVFISNVLKCRPPKNRDPLPEEIEVCGNYLLRQLEVIKPSIIICLGRFSASFIFKTFGLQFSSITKLQGKIFEVEAWGRRVKIVSFYHPAAILYKPQLRAEYEENFKKIGLLIKRRQKSLLDY
ncbi:MAG: type-4 uracil-DNA glycosylase [Archaeoglobaceae archaeon]|nr:type-4 uracil-DNA glycosylase [Archaeoglobaceae archaeon]MDW7989492.1 type-4 uracil-DNA glycosylase [Archaeoglobaceae archaeon]